MCSPCAGRVARHANSWPESLNGGAYSREPSPRVRTMPRAANCGSLERLVERSTGVTQQSTASSSRPVRERCLGEDRSSSPRTRDAFVALRELARHEIGPLERFAQRAPELFLQRADGEPAPVARRIDAVARNAAGQEVLAARRTCPRRSSACEREDLVRERRVGHRDVDVAARGRCAARRRAPRGARSPRVAAPPSRSAICRLHSAGGRRARRSGRARRRSRGS